MLNRTILVGRLTKDPELRYAASGTAICTFTLAVNRTFTNQQGEREADYPQIKVFKKAAENVANFTKKGSLVGVDGRIQTGSYEKDGRKIYTTEVIADSVQFLEPKGQQNSGQNRGNQQQSNNNFDPFEGDPFNSNDVPF